MQEHYIAPPSEKQPITEIGKLNLKNKMRIKAHKRGSVYAFTPEGSETTKIGYSTAPDKRLKSLLRISGFPKSYLFNEVKSKSCFWLEQEVHAQLDKMRLNDSEWFRISNEHAIQAIKEVREGLEPMLTMAVNLSLSIDSNQRDKNHYKREAKKQMAKRAALVAMHGLIASEEIPEPIAGVLMSIASDRGDRVGSLCWRMKPSIASSIIELGFLELLSGDDFGEYLVAWSQWVAAEFIAQQAVYKEELL